MVSDKLYKSMETLDAQGGPDCTSGACWLNLCMGLLDIATE